MSKVGSIARGGCVGKNFYVIESMEHGAWSLWLKVQGARRKVKKIEFRSQ
jgi:hypothetical protein